MKVCRVLNFFGMLLVSVHLASCAYNKNTASTSDEVLEVQLSKNANNNIYAAWEGGIGGTGISNNDYGISGTGIVGTISAFGSIVVNGLHIEYSKLQPLESFLGNKTAASLAIGNVVAIEADLVEGQLVARRIIEQIALSGTVESVDLTHSKIIVAGELVVVLPNNNGTSLMIEDINIGSQIAISGLRDSGALYASQVSPVPSHIAAFASGTITNIDEGRMTVDNSRTFDIKGTALDDIKVGDFVGIKTDGNSYQEIQSKTFVERIYGQMFDGRVTRTAVEGFFASHKTASTSVDPLQKGRASRQVVFKTKDSKNRLRTVGYVELDRKNWKNPRFETPSQGVKKQSKTANPDRPGPSAGQKEDGGKGGNHDGGKGGGGKGGGGKGGGGKGGGGKP